MRNTLPFLLVLLFGFCFVAPLGAQTLRTQAEVDAWDPDSTELTGYVSIEGNDIENIDALSNLTSIRGQLRIRSTSLLTDLSGLSNVSSISGYLYLERNSALENINALSNLSTISGSLNIERNDLLTNIDSLSNIEAIPGSISISYNGALTDINGLANVSTIPGRLAIQENNMLTDIDALNRVTKIDGTITIKDNISLENIAGLSNVTSIGGRLTIDGNNQIVNIDGLSNVNSVEGYLYIQKNESLENIDGLSNLVVIPGSLQISSNESLSDISSLSDVSSIDGSLTISNNNSLVNIDALSNVRSIDGQLVIQLNSALTNITGLSNLASAEGRITIAQNNALLNIDGLSGLNSILGNISIERNESLQNINGLSDVTSVTGHLGINYNTVLPNIDGLNGLASVEGSLNITNNAGLLNIDGLSSLTALPGRLSIERNESLEHIDGLANLTTIPGTLSLRWNESVKNIDGLTNVVSILGIANITWNNSLANIDGLNSLTTLDGRLSITNNPTFNNIDALEKLTNFTGSLTINSNDSLKDINGLSNLKTFEGRLSITSNLSLLNIEGLSQLTSIGGSLSIERNEALTNVDGLSNLASVDGSLIISGNNALTNVDGLIGLTSVPGNITIRNNDSLANIDGLINISSISGTLTLDSNNSLTQIDGFANLASLEGTLSVSSNSSLIQINSLSMLTTIVGHLRLERNNSLDNTDGLLSIDTIIGAVRLRWNNSLSSVSGLSNLVSISGTLSLEWNDALRDLNGLASLNSISGNLSISHNDALNNIEGLSNISSMMGRITLSYNDALSECCILLPLINGEEHGELNVYNNAAGCVSVDEILNSSCGLTVNYESHPPCIGASNGSIEFSINNYEEVPFAYSWAEASDASSGDGESQEDIFSIDGLPSGTYSVTITEPDGDETVVNNINLDASAGSSLDILDVSSQNATFGQDNGAISLGYSGGQPPYSISLTGPTNRTLESITDLSQEIANLLPGEYSLFLYDANNQSASVNITLVDEEVNTDGCSKPMDIIILNLVSGAISSDEYIQSKDYFEEFYKGINLGLGAEDSRVAIAEWSSRDQQEVKIDITGDDFLLGDYENLERSFTGGTDILSAMQFGNDYLQANARPSAQKVIIFTFDGCASFSAAAYAEELKESGMLIADIGIGVVNSSSRYRQLLIKAATVPEMAYFGNDFTQLDPLELAVSLAYSNCSGSTSNIYFNRDGEISIDDYSAPGCPYPNSLSVSFTVSSLEQLSIPTGTPVSFYHNDPTSYGSSLISTFTIPCSIPAGGSETFTTTVPIETATHLYAVLNDVGDTDPAFDLPVTEIIESRYSNNISSQKICVDQYATLQALKSSVSLHPICESIVQYTISVCNISEVDAQGVTIEDLAPADFTLKETTVNTNGCSSDHSGSFDIPANCCVSLTLSYDVSSAAEGYYGNQGVNIDGPSGQTYISFDGASTSDEDILLDGEEECGNPSVSFRKEVDHETTCSDHSLTYIYYIENKSSTPLYGIQFTDVLPVPLEWVYKPYNKEGLSIASSQSVEGQTASFIIDQIDAETVASFEIDVYVGETDQEVFASSSAILEGFPSYINNGIGVIESNETTTKLLGDIHIDIVDTILLKPTELAVDLNAIVADVSTVEWTSTGDGTFSDHSITNPVYQLGEEDMLDSLIGLFISVDTYCGEKGVSVLIKRECELALERMRPVDICDGENHSTSLNWSGGTGPYTLVESNSDLGMSTSFPLDDVPIGIHTYTIEDAQGCRSRTELELNEISSIEIDIVPACKGATNYEIEIAAGDFTLMADPAYKLDDQGQGKYVITDIPNSESITLTAIDAASGCEKEFTVNSPSCGSCQALAILGQDQELTCQDELAVLDASASSSGENFSGVWSNEKGDTLSTEFVFNTTEAGLYTFTVSDLSFNCSSSETIQVTDMRDLPMPSLAITAPLCHEDATGAIEILNVAGGNPNYTYSLEGEIIIELEIKDLAAGEYNLRVEDAVGCSFDTLIKIQETPLIQLESDQNLTTINQGMDLFVELNTNLNPDEIDSILWEPSIDCVHCLEYTFEDVLEELDYTVTLIDINGCEATMDLMVAVNTSLRLYLPNVITANEGNSLFVVQSSDRNLMIEEMSIYDRWGKRVFSKQNFPANDPQYGWDGMLQNQALQSGVYTYVLTTIRNDKKLRYAGDVTLLR